MSGASGSVNTVLQCSGRGVHAPAPFPNVFTAPWPAGAWPLSVQSLPSSPLEIAFSYVGLHI
eukprot:1593732-Prymnesium_polylepis.1